MNAVLEELYRQVVYESKTTELKQQDLSRINLLEAVVSGKTEEDYRKVPLEVALRNAEKHNAQSGTAKILFAKSSLREWYLQPSEAAKEGALARLTEAGLDYIINAFPDCLAVLQKHRVAELKKEFDKIIEEAGKRPTEIGARAILVAAREFLASKYEEIENYVVHTIPAYASQYVLDADNKLIPKKKA